MKFFELQPTAENVLNAFEKDLIGRNLDVVRFSELLNSLEFGSSIALDAPWGAGKTFFVKQVKMVLDAFNEHVTSPDMEERERVKESWDRIQSRRKPDLQPQVSVYYDAWLNDNDEDPALSLVYTILQSVNTNFTFKRGPDCLKTAGGIIEAITGKNLNFMISALQSEDPMRALREKKDVHCQIEEFFESLLAEQGNRIVIFIDELDRCKPTFAVQLLERIKHYFSNDRITFVFSVNISELQHTIRRHYGDAFDACKYLDRFFDFRVALPPANLERLYATIGLQDSMWVYESVCRIVIEANHFSLREITKFYRLARTAAHKPMHDNNYNFSFGDGLAMQFCLMCLVPIMLGLKISDQMKYEAFVRGEDSSPLHQVLRDNNIATSLCGSMLSPNETYDPAKASDQQKLVKLSDKLDQVYDALFVYRYTSQTYGKRIGGMYFRAETQNELLKAVSALSEYADYEI